LLFACAFAAEYLGSLFERLSARAMFAQVETERAQALWVGLIERLPVPVLLVDPDSFRIVAASELAQEFWRIGIESLQDSKLFDSLHFSYPDTVQELITGTGGVVPRTVIHVGDETRMTEVRVIHIAHKRQRLALVALQDVTELFHVKTV